MTAVHPFEAPAPRPAPSRRRVPSPRRGGGAVRSIPPTPAEEVVVPTAQVPLLSQQLQRLERELREVWTALVEQDSATAGRVGYAGRLVHQAAIVLGDHSVIA